MRFSALMLAGLSLGAGPLPDMRSMPSNTAYFCGAAPQGWVPPGQPRPLDPPRKDAPCHIMPCDRQTPRSKVRRSLPA